MTTRFAMKLPKKGPLAHSGPGPEGHGRDPPTVCQEVAASPRLASLFSALRRNLDCLHCAHPFLTRTTRARRDAHSSHAAPPLPECSFQACSCSLKDWPDWPQTCAYVLHPPNPAHAETCALPRRAPPKV